MIDDVVKHLRAAVQTDPAKYQIVLTHDEAAQILDWIAGSVRDERAPGGICENGHEWFKITSASKCIRCGEVAVT